MPSGLDSTSHDAPGALPEGGDDLGHRFTWLHTGDDAYAAMESLIDAAGREAMVEFYTVAPGPPADRLEAALRRAASRGVRVQVLLDAFGSSALPLDWDDGLRAAGIDVRRFNPRPSLRWTFRDHRKLVVADERTALVGGYNVTTEFEGDGIVRGWRDLGLVIEGPVAADLALGFRALFEAAPLGRREIRPLARFLRRQAVRLDQAAVVVGGLNGPRSRLKRILADDLRAATRVDIAAAYFLPSRRLRRTLQQVARRGSVRLLLSRNSDVPVARLASEHMYRGLLRSGVALWEYEPQVMHTKALVIDEVVYVGSANLDARSLQLNFELLVRLPSATLAGQLRARLDHDIGLAQPVPADWPARRTLWQRLLQRWSYFLLARVDPFFARSQFRHLR